MPRTRNYAQWALILSLALGLSACATSGGELADEPTDAATTDAATDAAATDDATTEGTGDTTEPADDATTGAAGGTVTVASKDFTEQIIVAEMYAQALEDSGFTVERNLNLGSSEVLVPALENGEVDLYPEYIGTGLEFLNGGAGEATADVDETLQLFRAQFEDAGVTVLEPAEASDANVFTVTQETADEYSLAAVSDLQPVAGELTLGGPPECPERPLCQLGLVEVYDVDFGEFRPLDAGGPLTVAALDSGEVDVALMFTTLGIFADRDYVQLEDDMGLQPAENIAPVVRAEALTPEIEETLNAVSAELTTEDLIELNKRVDIDNEDPEAVAEEYLTEKGLLGG